MKRLLDAIVTDEGRSGNAKLRRRLGRVKESLDKVTIVSSQKGSTLNQGSGETASFTTVLAAVKSAKTDKELESSVTGLPSSIDSNDEESVQGMIELQKLLNRLSEDKDMVSTAPQRRKIKRAQS